MNSPFVFLRFTRSIATFAVALTLIAGCKSKQDAALDQAKQQANTTGQAQQVVSTDKNGNVSTTVVQPLQQGQTTQAVTTTVTPAANAAVATPGQPVAAASTAPQPGTQPAPPANLATDPVIRPADVHVQAGTPLAIRIDQHISVKTTRAGDHFTGEVEEAVVDGNNRVIIPRGAPVEGIVDASHRRGHFKGSSILELRLTTLTLNGSQYALDTHDLTRTKKGKGKRSAAFIGGGTGLGMLVGGVATGGVGLLVGGLAGAGTGTAIGGLTGNRDIEIPAESVVRFRLADDLVVQAS
ncbi:hypothetical protein HDF16_003344 [Granulicella aggregans]|uniref:Uncharacterized protein n=1 Tax=Granulicella aggregans TaxID=474949 RepID=A0A7W7ZEV2_9BACT|nr:hypothetical protein [Granulicella aggregans]MBB5058630.1 hypothetical protein [Granulicella aggregans]